MLNVSKNELVDELRARIPFTTTLIIKAFQLR
jgi:hypothetical protein